MKKSRLLLLIGSLALCANLAFAKGDMPEPEVPMGFYVGIQGGANSPGRFEGVDFGWNVGGQIGYQYDQIRGELAFNYYDNDTIFASSSIGSYTLMINAYYDFLPYNRVQPFLGVGIGWIHFDFPNWSSEGVPVITDPFNQDQIAGQVIGGVAYNINPNLSTNLNLRLLKNTESGSAFYSIMNMEINYHFG